MTLWEQVQEEFKCSHSESHITRRINSAGGEYYIRQCLICGQPVSTQLPKKSVLVPCPNFDQVLCDNWLAERDARYEELQTKEAGKTYAKQGEWWDRYTAYLNSPEWQVRRKKVLARDNYLCQACLERKATQAHHLTYEHVFNEPLFELIAICEPCHTKLTQLDAQRRNGNGLTHLTTRATVL